MMLLSETVTNEVVKSGSEIVDVPAGTILRIETSPGGGEILDIACPEGKAWTVSISVTIKETNI